LETVPPPATVPPVLGGSCVAPPLTKLAVLLPPLLDTPPVAVLVVCMPVLRGAQAAARNAPSRIIEPNTLCVENCGNNIFLVSYHSGAHPARLDAYPALWRQSDGEQILTLRTRD
jgi:hypothetical protein